MSKVLAALGIIVGSIGIVFALCEAFGVHITADQQSAVAGAAGLVLAVLGVWFHPSTPFGPQA